MKANAFFLSLFFLIISCSLQSQSFRPGVIVRSDGEQISGQLALKIGRKGQQQVLFRTEKGKSVQRLTPNDLSAFTYQDLTYVANEFTITRANGSSHTRRSFAKVSFSGEKSLYRIQNRGSQRLFVLQSKGGPMIELLNSGKEVVYNSETGKSHMSTDRRFRDQLYQELPGCDQLTGVIVNTSNLYTEKQLQRLLRDWHTCTGNKYQEDAIAEPGLGLHLYGLHLYVSSSIKPNITGFGATAEFRPKGFSLWALQAGMEFLTDNWNFQESIYGFPLAAKRIIPVNHGEFYGLLGFMSGITTEQLIFLEDLRVRLIPVFLFGVGYEASQVPLFLELRAIHTPLGPDLGLRAGFRL